MKDVIRVRQVAPGVWAPDPEGEFEIFASMLPMFARPAQDSSQRAARIAAGITESLAAQARRDAIGVRVRLTQEAYTAYLEEEEPDEYVVVDQEGERVCVAGLGEVAKCGCPDCTVLPAGVTGPFTCPGCSFRFAGRTPEATACQYCGQPFPAGVTGPPVSGGYDWEAALSGGYVSRDEIRAAYAGAAQAQGLHPMTRAVLTAQQAYEAAAAAFEASKGRPAMPLASGTTVSRSLRVITTGPVLRNCEGWHSTGNPVQATVDERPAPTEKRLAPAEPPDPAEEIRLSLLEPVHMDQAELDRLVPYDKAPAGLCLNCHLGAVLPGRTLCYYCNLSGELAAQAKVRNTAQAAGNLIAGVQEARSRTPGTRPGPARAPWSCTCKCPSRKMHEIKRGTRPAAARLLCVATALLMLYLTANGSPFLLPVAVAFIILARTYGRRGPR